MRPGKLEHVLRPEQVGRRIRIQPAAPVLGWDAAAAQIWMSRHAGVSDVQCQGGPMIPPPEAGMFDTGTKLAISAAVLPAGISASSQVGKANQGL